MRRCGPIAVKDQVSYSMRHLDELRRLEADLRETGPASTAPTLRVSWTPTSRPDAGDQPTPSAPWCAAPTLRSPTSSGWPARGDPQVVRWVLKKCLLLERNPEAGEELRGGLIGCWKLTVGDRDWSIVWRVTSDDTGLPVFDIAEVWAVGARSDSEVYTEMESRVATLSATPATVPLAEAIARLGKVGRDLTPSGEEPEPDTEPAMPGWLIQVLTTVVGMPLAEVDRLTEDQAQNIWHAYTRTPR